MAFINQSLQIKSVTFPNRIGLPPMCMYSSQDGFATKWHTIHYATRAMGGAGLVILEATAVTPEGRITPSDLGIWKDEHIPGLKDIADQIHANGSVAAIQLAHAGRKASHDVPSAGSKQRLPGAGGWQTVAPSPIPFGPDDHYPMALDKDGIRSVVNDFREAARRSLEAGFKVIEIHAAHGYLLQEFLSPLSNVRTDEYGGSIENRMRFLLEVIEAVKTVWPEDLPLFVRLSATEWKEGGWELEDTLVLCKKLKEMGVDFIDCSTGGNIYYARIPLSPGYQVHFAEAVRAIGLPTAAVGLITTVEQINEILQNEQADMVFLGRLLLRDPFFPIRETSKTDTPIAWPVQYVRGK